MQYQTFPDVKGGSDSLSKLSALRLPVLKGKDFLDVGCNEGFFVGFALYSEAKRAVGIDLSKKSIYKAKKRFPEAELHAENWNNLPSGNFDVITMLSALHYAEDQEALIHSLMRKLKQEGVLILEISISPGSKDKWIPVERSIDTCLFPTRVKLSSILNRYAWKIVGKSVTQPGDPLQRYVIHVRKFKPYVYLLMGEPGSGKSTLARHLFDRANIKVISGDTIYKRISIGEYDVSDSLRSAITEDFDTAKINDTVRKIIHLNLFHEMIEFWISMAGDGEFAIDSYVPKEFHGAVKDYFLNHGYFPIPIDWDNGQDFISLGSSVKNANNYFEYLNTNKIHQGLTATVKRLKIPSSFRAIVKANLDSPVQGEMLDEKSATVKLTGWVVDLSEGFCINQFYWNLKNDKAKHEFLSLTRKRKDVIEYLKNNHFFDGERSVSEKCGFSLELPFDFLNEGLEIGFIFKNKKIPVFLIGVVDGNENLNRKSVFERVTKKYNILGG